MPAKRTKSHRLAQPSRRTQIVWVTFISAMTVVTGLLAMNDSDRHSGFLLTSIDTVQGESDADESVFQIARPLDRQRWTGIVVHHSGEPAGDVESLTQRHLEMGYQGLGYHFLIGNGNGLGDGVVHVGYRWNEQLPGAHVMGQQGQQHNQRSISICLIGNGDRRPFTDLQMAQLGTLVQRLQSELGIRDNQVHLHRDLSVQTTSPGKFFASAQFREQLNQDR